MPDDREKRYMVRGGNSTRIATLRRRNTRPAEPPARDGGGEGMQTQVDLSEARYLVYGGRPHCAFRHRIFSMHPVEEPSLGYKLADTDLDYGLVMTRPKIVSEMTAVRMLFAELEESRDPFGRFYGFI